MGKFYIYNSNIGDKKYKSATIIFNPNIEFDFGALKNELTEHFRYFHQTSALVFLHCSTVSSVESLIKINLDKIFKSIPKAEENSLVESIFYVGYNKSDFIFSKDDRFLKENFKEIINQGLANIFISNGGLVESNGISHHYVFPSGKHSTKFLRTANVLVQKSEIDFIGLNLLHLFKNTEIRNIYCDTLSINVVGYSISQYLKRYDNREDLNIESFKSYDGIYSKNTKFYKDSIFLISASTSGGLVHYLKGNHPEIDSKDVCILYYLPIEKPSNLSLERVLCNLERNEKFQYGLEIYKQFKAGERCSFCENQSTAIKIVGDSFSLDEPIINTRNIVASKYITKTLKDFVEVFKYNEETGTSLKVSFSEDTINRKKYNLYIDYENIIRNIEKKHYKSHKSKIDAFVNQYVPASLKYIIHLNDKGSELLAKYILEKTTCFSKNSIEVINQSELVDKKISEEESGSILIVASCITNGKNLLYLSRYFRNYNNIRLIYFIGINRISDSDKHKELKSNIKYGLYGAENSSFVEIETINCDNSNIETPWEIELDHLREIQEGLNEPSSFVNERITTINNFSNKTFKGGTQKIFYPDILGNELQIRKNSAFFNSNDYFEQVTQSDIYFTISCVLNNLRNNRIDGLYQTNFVKNLLDPFVFNRFNDGIIQASILRAAKNDELNYSFSRKNSEDMLMLLKTFAKHSDEYQGEALMEFLYALSIGRLRLFKDHYPLLIDELENIEHEHVKILCKIILEVYEKSL
ncbi:MULTISPECIES: hypothetical protein [Bacteroidota]|uniref:Uncharacterized protein n=2 Tax=Pseudomonadati TaxID=3379134 RepID=A0A7H9DQX3_9FLAO|nr:MULTISPECIES: hypothetical protein [Bacteroidota]OJZ09685.1 MAG: hypothetical protein BGP15_12515 [Sphingobacterium sp. 40-24]QLL57558.1 hypothetical protein FH779_05465 [Empedobacter falsenii]